MKKRNGIIQQIFLFALSLTVLTACIGNLNCEKGNEKISKQERKISAFSQIEVSGAYTIILKQDSVTSVSVEADENLQSMITTKIEGKKLVIENKKSICGSIDIIVYVSTPEINTIDISGAVELNATDIIKSEKLGIYVSGAAEIDMNIICTTLDLNCSGSGKLTIKGSTDDVDADLSGASDINAYELATKNFNISSSGAGKACISVSEILDVEISGAATVYYKGNPEVTKQISGVGVINKVK